MSYSPTIIAASLDDAELRKSIDKLVNHVDDQLHYMVASTKVNVKSINDALKTIGNVDTKLGSKGSKDGGAAKQVKAQEELGEATRKTTSEIKRQGKDVDMTFDQIAAALSQARREVSNFNTSRASGILPDSEAYRRYEQALARIVEYNDKLKQSALTRADANQWANAFDAKRAISDVTAVDSRLQQLNKFYADLEKQSDRHRVAVNKQLEDEVGRRSMAMEQMRAFYQEQERLSKEAAKIQNKDFREAFRGALSMPANNVDEVRAKMERLKALLDEMRDKKDKGLISISESDLNRVSNSIARLNQQIDKDAQKRLAAIEKESAAQKKLKDEQYNLMLARTNKIPTDQLDFAQTKLERLQALLREMRERGILSPKQIATMETEIRRLEQMIGQVNTAQQQTTQSAQRYTEEIRKQADVIRASKDWQEKGMFVLEHGITIYKSTKDVEQTLLEIETARAEAAKSAAKTEKERLEYISEAAAKAKAFLSDKKGAAVGYPLPNYKVASEGIIYAENDARAKGLTIEQQIEEALKKENILYNELVGASARVADNEKAITQEQAKRKKYVAPEAWNADIYGWTRSVVAKKLGIDGSDVINADASIDSIKRVGDALKQLQSAYSRMTNEERNSPIGRHMLRQMQELERQSQKLRAEMSRPVSLKEALGHPEKTLDDLAYKMRQLALYRSGINFETQKNEIEQVNKKYAALQKKMNEVMAKNNSLANSNNVLANSWRYMRNRMAFYLTVGTGASFVRDLARVRSEYEMNEKALGVLIGSAERGTRIFNELSNMALVSPYTLIELSSAAKQLTAYDIAAKDVVDTTRRLADISAAVGIPVERLTYALGQVKAYGHLTSQDARQFLNAGVPLVKELADRYSELEGRLVSTADVYDRMKKHAVSYNDVISVLTSMTDEGGRFFDYQAKMAETLKVCLANLSLAYNNMLNEIGKTEGGTINMGVKGLTVLLKHWRGIERIIGTVVVALGAYKAASLLAASTGASAALANAKAWFSTAKEIKSAGQALTYFSMAAKSVPVAGWVTAIASLLSYFWLFNNSADETKQKLEDIATAFEGIRKETTNLYADAISTDSFGTEMTKLRDMLELAETELGITIPVKLEDVNKHNIEQKLKEAKQFIDDYVNFSQTFTETAVDTRFGVSFEDFGKETRSVYTSIVESVNTVKVALQGLADTGKASKQELAILKDLDIKPKDGEATLAFFQRLIASYEKLGLISQKEERPWYDFSDQAWNPMLAAEKKQEDALDRLGIKNKTVFENLLNDVQNYYDQAGIATGQFIQQIDRLAERKDLKKIPKERKTLLFEVAINQFAAQNNWNEFAISYAKMVANKKFGTSIIISPKSKAETKSELIQWQRELQAEADKRKITLTVAFAKDQTEAGYASQALSEYKSALDDVATLERKVSVGTASAYALQKAKDAAENARKAAILAGADLASLEKKTTKTGGSKKDLLGEAVQKNVQYINEIRKAYEDFKKDGLNATDAVEAATKHFGKSLARNNKELAKYGIQGLTGEQFATMNLQQVRDYFQNMINGAQGSAKAVEILEKEVKNIDEELIKFNQKAIADSLNNELSKLKDEYELAIALDADPEMGNIFADMMGINTETLPHTVKEYADEYTTYLNKFLAANKSDLQFGEGELFGLTYDDIAAFQKQFEEGTLNEAWFKEIKKAFDAISGMRKKYAEDTIKEWNKLLEKYAEYEVKVSNIQKQAQHEREVARKKGASQEILDAIDNWEKQELARLEFEEFQKSPEWIVATGDVADMAKSAIGMLINELERYKKSAKNLSPKQIKQLNSALSKLYKEQRKNSPFKAISNMMQEAKERMATFDEEIKELEEEIEKTTDTIDAAKDAGEDTSKQMAALDELTKKWQELKDKQQETGKIDASSMVGAINETIGAVQQGIGVFNDLAKAIGGVNTNDLDKVFSVIEKGGMGAATGAMIGGGVGAIIGAVAGIATGLISVLAGAANERITEKVEKSERAVKALENTYRQLEHTASNAYGAITSGAKKALQANKELQLIELQRQLTLEKSRDSKDRDESKILDLEGQIIDLKNEIHDATQEIINDLLGISSAGEGIESMVEVMIEAFRNGEDAMEAFSEKWDEMIDNMTLKLIVTTYMQKAWDELMSRMQEKQDEMMKSSSDAKAAAQKEVDRISEMSDEELGKELYKHLVIFGKVAEVAVGGTVVQSEIDAYRKAAQAALTAATTTLDDASFDYTKWSLDYMNTEGREFMDRYAQMLKDSLGEWYTYGENAENNLSSLQQGISGITEDTAGAIEAYLNGVSQQVYLHSDLLTQIRDAVQGFDLDVQLGVQSQMLLQLQNSYQTQQAILSMLEGWTNPSGQAVRVELVS